MMCRCCVSKKIQTGSSVGSSSSRILNNSGKGQGETVRTLTSEDILDRLFHLIELALRIA